MGDDGRDDGGDDNDKEGGGEDQEVSPPTNWCKLCGDWQAKDGFQKLEADPWTDESLQRAWTWLDVRPLVTDLIKRY